MALHCCGFYCRSFSTWWATMGQHTVYTRVLVALAYKSPPKNRVRMWSKIIDPRISRRWLLRTWVYSIVVMLTDVKADHSPRGGEE